jgi:hypothetical protein
VGGTDERQAPAEEFETPLVDGMFHCFRARSLRAGSLNNHRSAREYRIFQLATRIRPSLNYELVCPSRNS